MCTGRVDLSFIIRAFKNGADGVVIGGCWPGECHYVTEGNFDALGNVHLCRKLLKHIGIIPERVRLEWISASEGSRFAEIMNDFARQLREFGSLGRGEGIDETRMKINLKSISQLVPYIKLVERARLRVPLKSEEAYSEFYASDDINRLFNELIVEKLVIKQILTLLEKRPLSTGKISKILGMNPREVTRHLNSSSRHGFVKYDLKSMRYALA
jgi:coenzyme F420-reducing hydrogenase delta subunit